MAPSTPLAHLRIFAVLATLTLLGAGCLGTGSSSSSTDGGVFKTVDGGTKWTQQTAIPSYKGVGSIGSTNVLALEMDPEDNKVVYAGTRENGLLYSLDGATSWQQTREEGLKDGAVSDVEVDATNVCALYVAKGQRLYKTTDCARSFNSETYVETRAGVTITEVAADWYDPNVVWLGLSNGDVLRSDDGGAKWQTSVATKEEITGILVSNADSRAVLVSTKSDGFFKTIDAGATWTQIKDELKQFKNAAKVSGLVQDETAATVVASTSYGLIRSKDFGTTWEALQLLSSPGQVAIYSVAIDPADANVIVYAAGSTFYRSTDGGVKWTTSKISSARVPTAVLMDPTDNGVVYLGVASAEK